MGSGDLNLKKAWHPGTFKNQEEVWKREQLRDQEAQKLEQLKKELQEERDREELARLYDQGKNRKKKERLEWMYAAGPTQSQDFIDQEKEDYLLGKKKIGSSSFKTAEEDSSVAVAPLPTVSSMYGPSANTTRDFQAKVRDDPLMAFKRQEQASLQAVLKNPLKVSKLKDGKKSKKSKKRDKSRSRSRSPVNRRDSRDSRDYREDRRDRDRYSRDDRDYDRKNSSTSYYADKRSKSRSPRPSYRVDHEKVKIV